MVGGWRGEAVVGGGEEEEGIAEIIPSRTIIYIKHTLNYIKQFSDTGL